MYTSRSFFSLNLITNLIACLCVIMLSSCHKDPYQDGTPELPPITMEGKNTFGCLVNGKAWIPETDGGLFNERLLSTYDSDVLSIQARLRDDDLSISQIVRFRAKFTAIGIYQIPPPYPREMFTNSKNKPLGTIECTSYRCTPEDTEIEILYINTSQRIISGTFSYRNLTNRCDDVINITDGRFDVRY